MTTEQKATKKGKKSRNVLPSPTSEYRAIALTLASKHNLDPIDLMNGLIVTGAALTAEEIKDLAKLGSKSSIEALLELG